MKNKKENIVFELTLNTQSSYTDQYGNRRNTSKSYAIPAKAIMLHEDEDGDYTIRNIRYVKNQNSIFVEDQNIEEDSISLARLVSKPQFTDGVLAVQYSQKNLLEFLRNHPLNEANQHWNMEGQKAVFRERNPVEIARKSNEQNKKVINASRLVYDSDFVGKIVPIAQYLGFETDKESDLILWDVDTYARANPERFIELLDSPVIQRYSDIGLAVKYGIIRIQDQRVLWADGRQLLEAPANYDTREYFAEVSFDDNFHSAWMEIKRLMDKRTTPKEDMQRIAKPESSTVNDISTMGVEELTDKLKEEGIITWEAPFYNIGNNKIKGKAKLIEFVQEHRKELSAKLL